MSENTQPTEQPTEQPTAQPTEQPTAPDTKDSVLNLATEQETQDTTNYLESIDKGFFNEDGNVDANKLAKSYVELRKKLSGDQPSVKVEDYTYEFEHGDKFDTKIYDEFKAEAAELGIKPDQFNQLMKRYENTVVHYQEQLANVAPSTEQVKQLLQEEWGTEYKQNVTNMKKAWDMIKDPSWDESMLGTNPVVARVLARVGAQLGEGRTIPNPSTSNNVPSESEVIEIISDMSKNYYGNKENQQKVQRYLAAGNSLPGTGGRRKRDQL